jgi:hypothetical protein
MSNVFLPLKFIKDRSVLGLISVFRAVFWVFRPYIGLSRLLWCFIDVLGQKWVEDKFF